MNFLSGIKKNYSKFERRDFPFVYLIILFPVAQFLLFWVYVNASSIAFSFQDGQGAFTLKNFKSVIDGFTSETPPYGIDLKESLINSFILWIVGEAICFPISLITTYVLTRKIAGHYFFRICYIVPSLMGAIIWTMLVKEMVQVKGPILTLLKNLGVELPKNAKHSGLLNDEATAFLTIVIVRAVMGFVGNNAVLTGAYTRVPEELFESAELDGAGFYTCMFQIAIPCIWPTICTLLTFALCSVFTCDYNVYLFSNEKGDKGMSTIGFVLFKLTYQLSRQGGAGDYGYPAALGLTLTLFTLPVVLLGKRVLEKLSDNVEV